MSYLAIRKTALCNCGKPAVLRHTILVIVAFPARAAVAVVVAVVVAVRLVGDDLATLILITLRLILGWGDNMLVAGCRGGMKTIHRCGETYYSAAASICTGEREERHPHS